MRVTGYFGELGESRRPAKYLSERIFEDPAGHHADLEHSRERRADRRFARRRDDVSSRHDPRGSTDKATLLYSVEIPSTGGNTLFASGYAAYDTLDPAVRDKLEGRRALHHYNYGRP